MTGECLRSTVRRASRRTTSATTSSRWSRARRGARHRRRPRARDRRRLAGRHRRARRPARSRAARGCRCSTGSARRESAPAYVAGFRCALATGAELVLQMDCDFSHDPADVPRLIAACTEAPTSCSARARARGRDGELGSRSATRLARRLAVRARAPRRRVRDLTGGFKCFRRQALETIDLDAVTTRGYAFQIEITYRVCEAGLPRRRDPDHVRRPAGRRSRR